MDQNLTFIANHLKNRILLNRKSNTLTELLLFIRDENDVFKTGLLELGIGICISFSIKAEKLALKTTKIFAHLGSFLRKNAFALGMLVAIIYLVIALRTDTSLKETIKFLFSAFVQIVKNNVLKFNNLLEKLAASLNAFLGFKPTPQLLIAPPPEMLLPKTNSYVDFARKFSSAYGDRTIILNGPSAQLLLGAPAAKLLIAPPPPDLFRDLQQEVMKKLTQASQWSYVTASSSESAAAIGEISKQSLRAMKASKKALKSSMQEARGELNAFYTDSFVPLLKLASDTSAMTSKKARLAAAKLVAFDRDVLTPARSALKKLATEKGEIAKEKAAIASAAALQKLIEVNKNYLLPLAAQVGAFAQEKATEAKLAALEKLQQTVFRVGNLLSDGGKQTKKIAIKLLAESQKNMMISFDVSKEWAKQKGKELTIGGKKAVSDFVKAYVAPAIQAAEDDAKRRLLQSRIRLQQAVQSMQNIIGHKWQIANEHAIEIKNEIVQHLQHKLNIAKQEVQKHSKEAGARIVETVLSMRRYGQGQAAAIVQKGVMVASNQREKAIRLAAQVATATGAAAAELATSIGNELKQFYEPSFFPIETHAWNDKMSAASSVKSSTIPILNEGKLKVLIETESGAYEEKEFEISDLDQGYLSYFHSKVLYKEFGEERVLTENDKKLVELLVKEKQIKEAEQIKWEKEMIAKIGKMQLSAGCTFAFGTPHLTLDTKGMSVYNLLI